MDEFANQLKKNIDVLGPASQLKALLKSGQGEIQYDLFELGERVATIYFDPDLARAAGSFASRLEMVVDDAIEDLSNGAAILRKNMIGLVLAEGRIFPFAAPYGAPWPGTVVFSIGLRAEEGGAEEQPRASEGPAAEPLAEGDACAAIYRLIVFAALESGQTAPDAA